MNLDHLEHTTEKILLEIGISRDEYAGFTILILGAIVVYAISSWLYIRISCRKINCDTISEMYNNSRKIAKAVDKIDDVIDVIYSKGSDDHESIKRNLDKVDGALSDVKGKISELNGIMLVNTTVTTGVRRRIEHEDN